MVFSIQQLEDDSKLSQALRLEVLEQWCPRELVCDLLTRCHAWGERERSLNQLLLVYDIIARSLFRRLNLAAVLGHLVRGLRWLWSNASLRRPSAAALVYRRRQLGTPVLRHLFQRVCHPMATEQTRGAFRFGLRLMAIDGHQPQAEAKGPPGLLSRHWVADPLEQVAQHGRPQLTAAIDQRRRRGPPQRRIRPEPAQPSHQVTQDRRQIEPTKQGARNDVIDE